MSFSGPGFVLAIIAMSYIAWIITTYVRTKHGYPIENEWGDMVAPKDSEANARLTQENAQLKADVGRLEERLKVLERIATDPSKRLEDEIERLR